MPSDDDSELARKAYDMAVRNAALLDAHLVSCTRSAQALLDTVKDRHEALQERITEIAGNQAMMQKILLGATGTMIVGLFSLVAALFHSGAHL